MTLRGDQFDPAYMKLNPNGAVPMLIQDGNMRVLARACGASGI